MSRVLYVDCVSGVAGDMLLGALLDAGADRSLVDARLDALLPGLAIDERPTSRHGIAARSVHVRGPADDVHRRWADVRQLIDRAGLSDRAGRRAHDAFRRLATAEGRVHGIDAEEVHFHEVGAIDAIADVCGVATALDSLGVDRVVVSPLPLARGSIGAAHGRLPLPAPATLAILEGVPVHGVDGEAELVTPTGAALVRAIADDFGPYPAMRVEAVGYGAGQRDLAERPNVVRVVTGVEDRAAAPTPVVLVETTVDDLVPELVPDAIAACLGAGALDAWCAPVQMKKGRPGVVLSAIARPADEPSVARALLHNTTTLGVRVTQLRRWELERMFRTVSVGGEDVRVKLGILDGDVVNVSPEHDDCAQAARRTGRTVASVWAEALGTASRSEQGAAGR